MSQEHNRAIKYRPDIDGLRTVAVLPVVIFHLGVKKLASGGFVGVDVFFVISGYLITGIIHNSVVAGRFSVYDFYYRRIRRIMPAVSIVYIVSIVLSLILLFPSEQWMVSKAVVSSILFSSNIFFYSVADYFDEASKLSPVLHTWSLSVEEQFYFFVPPLMLLAFRFGAAWVRRLLALIAIASFIAAVLYIGRNPSAVFYLLPFRAWELLTGSLLAVGVIAAPRSRILAEGAALLGIALIAATVLLLTPAIQFPGWAAVPPVLGAALIIYAGGGQHDTSIGRLLAWRPVRFIGLISYSLYLWHWPVIVFYPYVFGAPDHLDRAIMLGLSFILAVLSWRFVEQPFRHAPQGHERSRTYKAAGVVMVSIAASALLVPRAVEYIHPTPPQVEQVLAQQDHASKTWREGQCFLTSQAAEFRGFDKAACLHVEQGRRNVLLLGDSHAAQYYPALVGAFPGVNWLQANSSGCRPVATGQFDDRCRDMMRYMTDDFLARRPPLDAVIIAGRWTAADVPAMGRLLTRLKGEGYRLIVIGPVPEYSQPLPRLVAAQIVSSSVRTDVYLDRSISNVDRDLKRVAEAAGARYISAYTTLCPAQCRVWAAPGQVAQFDYGHLTRAGSDLIVRSANMSF